MDTKKIFHLSDWLSDDELCYASKLTSINDSVLHDHDFYEIFYITKGSIDYEINGVRKTLHAGDLCFLNLSDYHIFLREDGNDCEHRDIIIRQSLFRESCDSLSDSFFEDIENIIDKTVNISSNQIVELENKCNLIDRLSISDKKLAKIEVKLLLNKILGYLFEAHIAHPVDNSPNWLNELMDRFNDINLLKGGIPEIIKPFYYTNEHICRAFKAKNHVTMSEYLNQRRLYEFANMLMYTNMAISEIYESLGINSISFFNKLFKKQYHTTPLKFRKQKEM